MIQSLFDRHCFIFEILVFVVLTETVVMPVFM